MALAISCMVNQIGPDRSRCRSCKLYRSLPPSNCGRITGKPEVGQGAVKLTRNALPVEVALPKDLQVLFEEAGRNRCLPTQFVLKAYPRGEANWSTTYSLLTAQI